VSTATDGVERAAAYRGTFIAPMIGSVTVPLVVLVVIAATIDWVSALWLLIAVPVIPLAVGGFQRVFSKVSSEYRVNSRLLSARFLDAFQGLTTLRLLGARQRMGRTLADAAEELVATVCRRAALDEVVAGIPEGLERVVGEMAERLSGGQRQRLAIARAMLRDPSALVLDEATSQLDALSEQRVLAGVREASAGRTVLVIAHRLATITDADEIVVMDSGRIVERGIHAELLAADGAYARLLDRERGSLGSAV
jgi:ABC-type multidrug transport system fused ATPase/permease subunit